MPTWFRLWNDAIREANFRADVSRFRYKVYWEKENKWWNIKETHIPLRSPDVK
jgi:hypothetical protein